MQPVTVHVGTVIREEWISDAGAPPDLELTIHIQGITEESTLLTALGRPIVLSRSVGELMGERRVVDAARAIVEGWDRLGLTRHLGAGQSLELIKAVHALEGK